MSIAVAPLHKEDPKERVQSIRKKRVRALSFRLALGVVLPTFLASLYYGFVAADRFESVATFTIQSSDTRPSMALDGLLGVVQGAGSSRDTLAVRDYIVSRDMLNILIEKQDFQAHFQSEAADFITRLSASATFEDTFEYYVDHLGVLHDTASGTLTLKMPALDAERAQAFAQTILEASEAKVNAMSDRARRDQIRFAQQEVEQAEARLSAARASVLELQGTVSEFSPEKSAMAALTIRSELEAELASARAELMQARSFMQEDAPQVVQLQQKVRSLSAQIHSANRRLVDPKNDAGLNKSIASFESARMEKEFAGLAYRSTLAALETARVEAARQHRYLVTIASPSRPDMATQPRRFLGILTVFVISLLVAGIGSLLVASVREHARV